MDEMMNDLKIEKISIDELVEYEKNAKKHPKSQIEQIIKSIETFGFNDPIAIDGDNVVIEGHGRLMALKKMGFEEVPVIRLAHMTEEEKKAYILAHNKLVMNSGFDNSILNLELNDISDIDMTDFGFKLAEEEEPDEDPEEEFTEVLGEEHNYIVLYFDNDIDWLNLISLIDVEPKMNLSTKKDGDISEKMKRYSVGRVFKGNEVLEKLRGYHENIN